MAVSKNKSQQAPQQETASSRRLKYGLSVGVLLLSLLIILGVVNWLASDAAYRMDLTERGRYSISQQTRNLLKSLDEHVTITLLFAESDPTLNTDEQRLVASQRREIEDVLRELRNKSDKIEVVRIDPTDHRTITQYDELIARLKEIYAEESAAYEAAAREGQAALEQLATFAARQGEVLIGAMGELPSDHVSRRDFQTITLVLSSVIPRESQAAIEAIDESLKDSPMTGAPFPDLAGAVSIVRAGADRAGTLNQIADFFEQSIDAGTLPESLAGKLQPNIQAYRDMASSLLDEQERVDDLKPLELSKINSALRSRNCVLLTSPTRATVLSYSRLFPPPGAQQAAEEATAGVRRFAGETVLASGIRQLMLTDRPKVIFCHSEQAPTILSGRPDRLDLASVASHLRDLGFDVQEWNVNSGPRPTIEQTTGQPVWVILPPAPTGQQMMTGAELADAAKQLVAEGANVMMNFFPGLVAGLGQQDPWNGAIEPLGVTADTGQIIVEQIPLPNGPPQTDPTHVFVDFLSENPIATAVRGEPTQLSLMVPLQLDSDDTAEDKDPPDEDSQGESPQQPPADSNVHKTPLLQLKPSERIWATDVMNLMQGGQINPPAERRKEPYTVAAAVERRGDFGLQRALIIGSAQWCWTAQVGQYDLSMGLPMYPGNSELFASGVCWLAHLDELIARSPRAESVARIENLGSGAQIFWRWALIGGLPVLSLVAGIFVAVSRRG
ncbi:MAG: Gldg family protein [Phycisphaerales bacterium]|nr:Gldg family protein [Phycisphaerales bacterium]